MKRAALAMVLAAVVAGPLLAQEATKPWETWQPPAVVLPEPNGFDTYLKAFELKEQVDKHWQVEEWQQAARAVPGGAPADPWGEGPPPLPLPDRVALYSDVLKLVRVALTQETRIPAPVDPTELMPYLARFRAVSRLLAMEAEKRRLEGDNIGAANSALDCLRVAQDASSQRMLISYLVGIACEAIANKSLDETIPELKAAECKLVLTRLLQIESTRLALSEMFNGEEAFARTTFRTVMMGTAQQQREMAAEWGLQAPELKTMLESINLQSWLAIGQTYELLRQVSRMPYPRQPRPLPTPEDHFAKIIMPAADLILFKEAQSRTALHVREAELAVRAYLLEKGHLPPSLTALAPEYVAELPSDPFGEGPLLSKLIGGKLVIYSVGPDLKDDGGKQMDTRFPEPKSKGDITVEVTAKP